MGLLFFILARPLLFGYYSDDLKISILISSYLHLITPYKLPKFVINEFRFLYFGTATIKELYFKYLHSRIRSDINYIRNKYFGG